MPTSISTIEEVNLTKDIATGDKFLNQYKLVSKLGTGHNGKVYLATTANGRSYAIKEISKVTKLSITNKDPRLQINKIKNEIDIMKFIVKHPKILRLYQVLDDAKLNKIFLVLEYCELGELKFGATHNYSLKEIRMIMRDVVLGLEYLHGIGIVHRDIKPSNLLQDQDKFVKISDFGVSLNKNLEGGSRVSTFGTPAFLAPELCCGEKDAKIDGKVDVWALGVTIYCLWFHQLPLKGKNEYELFNEIVHNEIEYPQPRGDEESQLVNILRKMLIKDPKRRISTHDLKTHPFLSSDLSPSATNEFLKFNETYLSNRNSNFSRTGSIQRRFKSIFRRRSSVHENKPSLKLMPEDDCENDHEHDFEQHQLKKSDITPVMYCPDSPSSLSKQSSPTGLKSNSMSTSSNSLNLNSLLRSKKDIPDYLDGSTYFQGIESDEESSSSNDDSDDNDGLYNDQDTLSFRIGPKRANSSLAMKTMNDYLDI